MNALSRLSIWQRIWFVLAAGSLICGLFAVVIDGMEEPYINSKVLQGIDNPECRAIVEMPPGTRLKPEPRYGNPCWELYDYRSEFEDARATKEGYIEHRHSQQRAAFHAGIRILVVVWLIAISLLYGVGQMVAWVTSGRAKLLFGVGAATCTWFAALAIELATRLAVSAFRQLGADLPGPTLLTISAVQSYLPWIIAVASTLIIVYLGMRASDHFLRACTVVAGMAAVLVSFVVVSMALPIISKCSSFAWPEWPTLAAESSGISEKAPNLAPNADAPKGAPVSSCR